MDRHLRFTATILVFKSCPLPSRRLPTAGDTQYSFVVRSRVTVTMVVHRYLLTLLQLKAE